VGVALRGRQDLVVAGNEPHGGFGHRSSPLDARP
jgi:hypothetical protein